MSLNETALMRSDDFAEFSQLVRRVEFLKMKSSPAWKYREAEMRDAYADVCDARFVKQVKRDSE